MSSEVSWLSFPTFPRRLQARVMGGNHNKGVCGIVLPESDAQFDCSLRGRRNQQSVVLDSHYSESVRG